MNNVLYYLILAVAMIAAYPYCLALCASTNHQLFLRSGVHVSTCFLLWGWPAIVSDLGVADLTTSLVNYMV